MPQSLFIAGFIGSPPINMISGEARDGVMRAGSIAFPFVGAPGEVTVGLRPRTSEIYRRRPQRTGRAAGADGATVTVTQWCDNLHWASLH
jgi:ABC-type sugar transport system ATPase subunit